MEWYRKTSSEVIEELGSSEKGLSFEEARKRLELYGLNELEVEKETSKIVIFLRQFTNPLVLILLIASVVTFAIGEYIDTGIILAVVTINAVIGYIEEVKAERSVRALKKMLVNTARVLRDGREIEIPAEELVPGDIVFIASGARVPADMRIIEALELKVDESMLTGESLPVEKTSSVISVPGLLSADQLNMAFMGTIVVSGRGRGIVVATGKNTVLGKIAGSVKEIGVVKTPIQKKFERFARVVGFLVMFACVLLFLVGVLMGGSIKDMFMVAVAGAVAAIPEGLPIAVTVAMAVGVARMAKKNAIIRVPAAVETLGSTTVICTDKTGTLTKNEMTVVRLFDGKDFYTVTGSGYNLDGKIVKDNGSPDNPLNERLVEILRIGLLCNESTVVKENGAFKVKGDPTEGALIISAMKGGLDPEEEKKKFLLRYMVPFESERGFMATLHENESERVVFIKGAPEKVVEMCKNCEGVGRILDISDAFAKEGLRVLCFAKKSVSLMVDSITPEMLSSGDCEIIGLQAMIDPPRPEVKDAISGCHRAGIRVVMITGDHAVTAFAIAKMLGIAKDEKEVITGKDLEDMSDDELYGIIDKISVYARVAPHHKLRITQQLMRRGEIVAMTGDGVNDAPALKAAHIGIAMGVTGTDVAREASDMVLADDNFASIFNAVKEGRIVFDNLRKVVFFLIPTGISAVISIIMSLFLGVPIPYTPAQLLWINLVTNSLQDVSLAFEPGEPGILDRPPRSPREGIMSRVLVERTILVSLVISIGVILLYLKALKEGHSVEYARTIAVTTMVLFQFFQTWNSRSERLSIFSIPPFSNKLLFASLIMAFIAQAGFIYFSPFQWLFHTESLALKDILLCLLMASSVIVVVEVDKFLRRVLCKESYQTAECKY